MLVNTSTSAETATDFRLLSQVGNEGKVFSSWELYRACTWTGTAESYRDLHQYLPPVYIASVANGIAPWGNIIGTAYTMPWEPHRVPHAVMWTPIKHGN